LSLLITTTTLFSTQQLTKMIKGFAILLATLSSATAFSPQNPVAFPQQSTVVQKAIRSSWQMDDPVPEVRSSTWRIFFFVFVFCWTVGWICIAFAVGTGSWPVYLALKAVWCNQFWIFQLQLILTIQTPQHGFTTSVSYLDSSSKWIGRPSPEESGRQTTSKSYSYACDWYW